MKKGVYLRNDQRSTMLYKEDHSVVTRDGLTSQIVPTNYDRPEKKKKFISPFATAKDLKVIALPPKTGR